MDATIELLFILVISVVNSFVAAKRGRSPWVFLALSLVPLVPVAFLASYVSQGDGTITGWAIFLLPVSIFILIFVLPTSQSAAIATGEHGEFVRCPFCAEAVRKQAIKCKHCASELIAKAN